MSGARGLSAIDISPYLVVVSPTKQCGKTTLLILIYWLTPRSVLASNISGPAAYRFIEKEQPTLIVVACRGTSRLLSPASHQRSRWRG